jgi:hypothetical protein
MSRRAVLALILTLVGVAIVALGWRALLQLPAWRTGPRVLAWYGPDGKPVALELGCMQVDVGMRAIVHGGKAWSWCRAPGLEHGALARVDAARGEGRILWPVPRQLAFASNTAGLYPGPRGQLGVVYPYGDVNGPLAAGVAGTDGWARQPVALPGAASSALLGGAWVGDALELVVIPTRTSLTDLQKAAPVIVRLGRGAPKQRRPFRDAAAVCRGLIFCFRADAAQHRGGRWYFLVSGKRSEADRSAAWWVSESGELLPTGWQLGGTMTAEHVDWVDGGLTDEPLLGQQRLLPDGSLAAPPAPPRLSQNAQQMSMDFDSSTGRLRRREDWYLKSSSDTVVHRVGARSIATSRTEKDGHPVISVQDLARAGSPPNPIAYTPGGACSDLAAGTFVEQPGGGLALVTDRCYVRLDADLDRLDPLTAFEHLRRRDSFDLRRDEARPIAYLLWTLGGLPVCVLLALLVARVRGRRSRPDQLTAVAAGAAIYVASGLFTLFQVLPLLT